ncbi:hypothetical protein [Lutibacter citreus]|uniref:hypothetical protein n=1 Tax=Lutibacter citreus TaxID=2138210 RepID=UPI000DBEA8DD|nr:hypothetical protein [Lutibacter citreus]
MAKKKEIKKNIKFYKKEIEKWELRILVSLILIFLGIIIVYLFYLKAYNWNITNIEFGTLEFPKLSLLTPFIFYLAFSARQFNYYKKQLDLYRLKYTEL